jgi:hypothetical protein
MLYDDLLYHGIGKALQSAAASRERGWEAITRYSTVLKNVTIWCIRYPGYHGHFGGHSNIPNYFITALS